MPVDVQCPKCSSANVIFSKKRSVYVCEDCGYEFTQKKPVVPTRIFLSYGHDDNEELVRRIKADLEQRGHDVWFDKTDIKAGDDWRRSITEGITSASRVLSFLSKHSVRSPGVCLDELRIALCVKGGYIKTVLLEREDEVCPPTTLLNIQWLDMSVWKEAKAKGKTYWEAWYAKRFSELCSVVESDEARFFAGEIQRLRALLKPNLSNTKEQYLLSREYVGRVWLDEELERWRSSDTASKAFVLLGGPGIGKSCFSAHQLHYNHRVLCVIFCEWDKTAAKDAKSVFQTLAFKLATKLPDYRKILLETLETADGYIFERMTPAEYFDTLLAQPLNELIDGGRERQIIIIDGLDEANTGARNELAEVLADSMFRLPSWIVFVLTSRPEYNIRALFASYNPMVLEPIDIRNTKDICQYIAFALSDELAAVNDRLFVLQEITGRCRGSFLYATLFAEGVKTGTIDLADIEGYPNGLEAFYLQNFRRKFRDLSDYRMARPFLELVAACQDIPVGLIVHALHLAGYDLADLLTAFGSLLRETSLTYDYAQGKLECLAFFHKSLADWVGDRVKAGGYYVDANAGAERLARCCLSYVQSNGKAVVEKPSRYFVGQTLKIDIDLLDDYIKTRMQDFFLRSSLWDDYRDFLLEPDTPLKPYWRALERFPAGYDFTALTDRLWADPQRLSFFETLQRSGESQFISAMIDRFVVLYGLERLDVKTLNIYIDIVHLSGDYPGAVSLSGMYLSHFCEEEILGDRELLHLRIRKLHHSMFYAPIGGLIEDAMALDKKVDGQRFPEEYNELLFLIGGNLGVLKGDFALARTWTERSLEFARSHGLCDYETRAVRKYADLLCLDGKLNDALELVSRYVSCDGDISSRYHMYLLGSLGEIWRRKGEFDRALHCFMLLEKLSQQRGIPGWQAHALLATANLLLGAGHPFDASARLEKAGQIYKKIDQKWGIIHTSIVRYGILLAGENAPSASDVHVLKSLLEMARSLQYLYTAEVIEDLLSGRFPDDFQLLFL